MQHRLVTLQYHNRNDVCSVHAEFNEGQYAKIRFRNLV